MNHSENLRGMAEFPNDVTADYLLDMAASMEHYEERIAELEDQNMRLRLALLELKERYSCSPWIHRQVDEAIRKEIT